MIEYKDSTTITYTTTENSSSSDPFYLQNLLYDLPFDLTKTEELTIEIIIPPQTEAYVIDDLELTGEGIKTNKIKFNLKERSTLSYQLFIANHEHCNLCSKKETYHCQSLPESNNFEKAITINLDEPHAQANIKCHFLGDQTNTLNLTTTQNHNASNTTSKLIVKSVLDDQAKLISKNLIAVKPRLTDVVADQMNKNLMLAPTTRVVSVPQLAIKSKKVACTHGATVTPLDPEELFYLASRGIEKKEAERTLIEAFLK